MSFCEMLKGYSRDFGLPARVRIKTNQELFRLIDDNEGMNPCFLSIAYYREETPFVRFIPFDFDGEMERVLKDTNRLIKDFEERDVPYSVKFSGRKGTHVVIELEFDSDNPQFLSPQTMRNIYMTCIIRNELETFDYHFMGNVNALLRIPDTLHEVSREPCVFLKEKVGEVSIEELCKRLEVTEHKFKYSNNFVGEEAIHPYPCLECFIKVPNPLNYCRVAFTIYRLKRSVGYEDIVNEMYNFHWVDWKERKTRYHVQKIIAKGYSMPSCRKLQQFGLCFGEADCKYSDNRIMRFIKKIVR